jgi:phosphoglycolate phosphatase-like HAD superfamily hydrolase
MTNSRTLIFDLDGVILSERGYWRVADATLRGMLGELGLTQAEPGQGAALGLIPLAVIDGLKGRSVNSNWDLTEVMLTAILTLGFERQPAAAQSAIASARADWAGQVSLWRPASWSGRELEALIAEFWVALGARSGHDVPTAWVGFLTERSPTLGALVGRQALRAAAHARFQRELQALSPTPETAVPRNDLRAALLAAAAAGWILGIATGRPRAEAIGALDALELTDCFDPAHVVTFDEVAAAQRRIGPTPLGKPHPYCLLQAAYPEMTAEALIAAPRLERPWLVYVGDAGSDLGCAQAAGAQSWMVLTGCADPAQAEARREMFLAQGATRVERDVLGCLDALIGAYA